MTQPVQVTVTAIKRYFDMAAFFIICLLLVILLFVLVEPNANLPYILPLTSLAILTIVAIVFSIRKKLIKHLKLGLDPFIRLQTWADLSRIKGEISPIESIDIPTHKILPSIPLKESIHDSHNDIGTNNIDISSIDLDTVALTIKQLQQQLYDAQTNDGRVDQLLRERALLDPETGIGNREFFTNRLEAFLLAESDTKEEVRGAVILIQCNEGELIESLYGRKPALAIIEAIIMTIKLRLQHINQYFIARRSEYELALLLPGFFVKETEKLANRLLKNLTVQTLPVGINQDEFIHMGITCFTYKHKSYQIMAEADMALRSAQLQGPSQWFMYDSGEVLKESAKGSLQWRTFLTHAIKRNAFVLFFQPTIASKGQKTLHHEVLAKVRDKQGQLVSARVFLPMAKKCGLSKQIDMLVFDQICRMLSYENQSYEKESNEKNQQDSCSLNLSVDSLLSTEFVNEMLTKLSHQPNVASRLIIEISEYQLVSHLRELVPVLQRIKQSGVRLLADKVGQYVESANYLTLCPISYVKLHQSIVLKIHQKQENQVFIQSLKMICEQRHVQLFALGVECVEEWHTLLALGIDGGQGHFFTEPVAQVANAIVLP